LHRLAISMSELHIRFKTCFESISWITAFQPKNIISSQEWHAFSTLMQQKMQNKHYLTLSTCTCSSKVALGGISSNPCLPYPRSGVTMTDLCTHITKFRSKQRQSCMQTGLGRHSTSSFIEASLQSSDAACNPAWSLTWQCHECAVKTLQQRWDLQQHVNWYKCMEIKTCSVPNELCRCQRWGPETLHSLLKSATANTHAHAVCQWYCKMWHECLSLHSNVNVPRSSAL